MTVIDTHTLLYSTTVEKEVDCGCFPSKLCMHTVSLRPEVKQMVCEVCFLHGHRQTNKVCEACFYMGTDRQTRFVRPVFYMGTDRQTIQTANIQQGHEEGNCMDSASVLQGEDGETMQTLPVYHIGKDS